MRDSSASPGFRIITSLRLGDRVTVRSDDGLLAAEYALFDPADIVLRATDPVTVREAGYMTTARDASLRLARAGVTPALAQEAALALDPEVAASYARGPSARGVITQLSAHELFDGANFSAKEHRYRGAWLDLASLTARLGIANASVLVQALHLTAALAEVSGLTPVHLSTASVTRERRPGERTHARVILDEATAVPEALRRLHPNSSTVALDAGQERQVRRELLARVRERLMPDTTPNLRAHLNALEQALSPRTMQLGPLADPAFQAIERQLAGGDASGIDEQLDDLERTRGQGPGIRYLRARAALLRGEQPPRSVAQLLSELAQEDQGFHEAALVAARTWLAAGEDGNARHFAKQLAENTSAPESERLIALEILDETADPSAAERPPTRRPSGTSALAARGEGPSGTRPLPLQVPARNDVPASAPASSDGFELLVDETRLSQPPVEGLFAPVTPRMEGEEAALPPGSPRPPPLPPVTERISDPIGNRAEAKAPLFPSLGGVPPPEAVPLMPSIAPASPSSRPSAPVYEAVPLSNVPPRLGAPTGEAAEGYTPGRPPPPPIMYGEHPSGSEIPSPTFTPPPQPAVGRPRPRGRMIVRYEPELAESLALPLGANEGALNANELPRTPLQARIAMTRLSRDLARDYRLWYGKSLRCNVLAIDAMQQHLAHRFAGAPITDEGVAWELRRHGAFLSEVLARALGAEWVDIGPTEPGYWAMLVPTSTRAWPIGRVYRFVALGHRARDLVSYYLELEARARETE
jgi:hypothetical protein